MDRRRASLRAHDIDVTYLRTGGPWTQLSSCLPTPKQCGFPTEPLAQLQLSIVFICAEPQAVRPFVSNDCTMSVEHQLECYWGQGAGPASGASLASKLPCSSPIKDGNETLCQDDQEKMIRSQVRLPIGDGLSASLR
eukprot:1138533-Pelagomonas_calceolata.AAC.3